MGNVFDHAMLGLAKRRNTASSLLTGLAAFWKMEEATGATRLDSTASLAHLLDIPSGNVVQAAGKIGFAVGMLAAGGALQRTNASTYGLNPGDVAWTRAGWFKCTNAAASQIIHSSSDGLTGTRFAIISNRFFADIVNNGTVGNITHTLPIVSDTWYCVQVFHDPDINVIGLAINGGASQTGAMGGPGIASSDNIFGLNHGVLAFDGSVDCLGHWNRLLTADEWAEFYNAGAGVEWPF